MPFLPPIENSSYDFLLPDDDNFGKNEIVRVSGTSFRLNNLDIQLYSSMTFVGDNFFQFQINNKIYFLFEDDELEITLKAIDTSPFLFYFQFMNAYPSITLLLFLLQKWSRSNSFQKLFKWRKSARIWM